MTARQKPGQPGQAAGTHFERTIETAERDAEIARYKIGRTYQQCADQFGVSKHTAHDAVRRAIDAAVVTAGRDVIAAELIKLDALEETAWAVLRANHIVVSDGRIMVDPRAKDGDGEKALLVDSKPVLMAIDRILRCQERRARLLGLDAPVRQEVRVVDSTDAAIEQLAAELAGFQP